MRRCWECKRVYNWYYLNRSGVCVYCEDTRSDETENRTLVAVGG